MASLIATGLSKPEIAKRLVLARGTVTNHVERILERLGHRSRAQIAAWATSQRLVGRGSNGEPPPGCAPAGPPSRSRLPGRGGRCSPRLGRCLGLGLDEAEVVLGTVAGTIAVEDQDGTLRVAAGKLQEQRQRRRGRRHGGRAEDDGQVARGGRPERDAGRRDQASGVGGEQTADREGRQVEPAALVWAV